MECLYTNLKDGRKCTNKTLDGSMYCQTKTHYPTHELYEQQIYNMIKMFEERTIAKDLYSILDVDGDGSCLFRCFLHFLIHNCSCFREYWKTLKGSEFFSKAYDIYESDDISKLSDIFNTGTSDQEDKLTNILQYIVKEYCYEHRDDYIKQMDITLGALVLMTHDEVESIQEYREVYNVFAGEPNYIEIESDEVYIQGKNKGKKKTNKLQIPDRWGGIPEIYAFGKLFEVNVKVYVLKKIAKSTGRIMNATEKAKSARLSKYLEINNNSRNQTIEMVISETSSPHYRLLTQK